MKRVKNKLMNSYGKKYSTKKKEYENHLIVGYNDEVLKDEKFDLDIMKISLEKYVIERDKL